MLSDERVSLHCEQSVDRTESRSQIHLSGVTLDAMIRLSVAEEKRWCAERRKAVAEYLAQASLEHGEIGEWPAWHVAPDVSIWAIESLLHPGSIGWWAISGDLPGDYCSADGCRHPRLAMKRIAMNWRHALTQTRPGAKTIGETGLPIELGPLLRARAELLLQWSDDASLWPEDIYGE